jgi:hypothetical protein
MSSYKLPAGTEVLSTSTMMEKVMLHVFYGLGGSQLVGSGNKIPLGAFYVGKKIKARLCSVSS